MSIKSKLLAGAATLALIGGVGTAGALTAAAATPSCGHDCIDIFSRAFGTHETPNYVLDVLRQGAKVGQPIILYRTSNTDPAEDFVPSIQGTTADFYAAGLVSAAVALHYGCIPAGTSRTAALTAPAPFRAWMTRRGRSSTRPSAWTPACASALPPRLRPRRA